MSFNPISSIYIIILCIILIANLLHTKTTPFSYLLPTFSLPTPFLLLVFFGAMERRRNVGNPYRVGMES